MALHFLGMVIIILKKVECYCCCVVVVFCPQQTSKVMSGLTVNLTTLFLSRFRPLKQLTNTLCTYFCGVLFGVCFKTTLHILHKGVCGAKHPPFRVNYFKLMLFLTRN